eukprot:1633779-Alexandrium_andersonii.AAC.1
MHAGTTCEIAQHPWAHAPPALQTTQLWVAPRRFRTPATTTGSEGPTVQKARKIERRFSPPTTVSVWNARAGRARAAARGALRSAAIQPRSSNSCVACPWHCLERERELGVPLGKQKKRLGVLTNIATAQPLDSVSVGGAEPSCS